MFADNRGFSVRYTAAITPSLVNVATVGLTRVGYSNSGTQGNAFNLGAIDTYQNFSARPFLRINPTLNASDDLTWTKSTHTVAAGFNFRNIDNRLSSYSNSYPSYSFSQGILVGLGPTSTMPPPIIWAARHWRIRPPIRMLSVTYSAWWTVRA